MKKIIFTALAVTMLVSILVFSSCKDEEELGPEYLIYFLGQTNFDTIVEFPGRKTSDISSAQYIARQGETVKMKITAGQKPLSETGVYVWIRFTDEAMEDSVVYKRVKTTGRGPDRSFVMPGYDVEVNDIDHQGLTPNDW